MSDTSCIPPFTMTEEITNLVIEIAELTGIMTVSEQLSKNPRLRRENRVKSIHSSLAIEQNSLTIDQVSDIIDGKRVLGPPQDIREAKNAYEAYELLTKLDPYSVEDLLKAHKIMMTGLVKEAGVFRSKGVGVFAGEQLIHAGTPANYVPELIGQLFDWLKKSKLHPLVKSCIFHYEFEFIHPFADGLKCVQSCRRVYDFCYIYAETNSGSFKRTDRRESISSGKDNYREDFGVDSERRNVVCCKDGRTLRNVATSGSANIKAA